MTAGFNSAALSLYYGEGACRRLNHDPLSAHVFPDPALSHVLLIQTPVETIVMSQDIGYVTSEHISVCLYFSIHFLLLTMLREFKLQHDVSVKCLVSICIKLCGPHSHTSWTK